MHANYANVKCKCQTSDESASLSLPLPPSAHPVSLCIRNRLDLHFWQLQPCPHPLVPNSATTLLPLPTCCPQTVSTVSHRHAACQKFPHIFLSYFVVPIPFPSPSHPIPIPIAVAALRLADCMRLHFRKFGIRCEQRTQVSNIWLIWIGTNCFWFTEALQDVSNEHKIWFKPHPRCSMANTYIHYIWYTYTYWWQTVFKWIVFNRWQCNKIRCDIDRYRLSARTVEQSRSTCMGINAGELHRG